MRHLRNNALTECESPIDPSVAKTQHPEYLDTTVERLHHAINNKSTSRPFSLNQFIACRLNPLATAISTARNTAATVTRHLSVAFTAFAFLTTLPHVHANSVITGPLQNNKEGTHRSGHTLRTGTNTSPLLQTISSLACAATLDEASSALQPLESNLVESWQLPNEWHGYDRPPALYAGSLDITVAKLIEAAEKYPELQARIDALLLSWNYCHVIGRDNYNDLPEQSTNNYIDIKSGYSLIKRPAENSPIEWSGLERLGIRPTEKSSVLDPLLDLPNYVPGLSQANQKTPLYRVQSFWQQYTQQCLPHPETGSMYYQYRAFGPTRIDLLNLHQLIAEPYPFNWDESCGITDNVPNETPAPELTDSGQPNSIGEQNPAKESLASEGIETSAETSEQSSETLVPEGTASTDNLDASTDEANTNEVNTSNNSDELHKAPLAENHESDNQVAQVDEISDNARPLEIKKKLPPSDAERLKIGKQKRLNDFKIRLMEASRNSSSQAKLKDDDDIETRLRKLREAFVAAATGTTLHKQDSKAKLAKSTAGRTTLDSYTELIVLAEQQKSYIRLEQAKRLSTTKAARVRLSRNAPQNQLDVGANVEKIVPMDSPSRDEAEFSVTEKLASSISSSNNNENEVKREKSKRLQNVKVARVQQSRTFLIKEPLRSRPLVSQTITTEQDLSNIHSSDSTSDLEIQRSKRLQKVKVARVQQSRVIAAIAQQAINGVNSGNMTTGNSNHLVAASPQVLTLSPYGTKKLTKKRTKKLEQKPRISTATLNGKHTPPAVVVLSARPKQIASQQQATLDNVQLNHTRPKVIVLSAYGTDSSNPIENKLIASIPITKFEYMRQLSKRLQATKNQRVRLSRTRKTPTTASPEITAELTALINREKNKRLHAVKIWRVILSRQYRQRLDENLFAGTEYKRRASAIRTNKFSPSDSSRLAFRQLLEKARSEQTRRGDSGPDTVVSHRSGRRYMTTATLWRVILSRAVAARDQVPGWKNAFTYNINSTNSPAAGMSRNRHGLRIWGEKWFSFGNGTIDASSYEAVAANAGPRNGNRSVSTGSGSAIAAAAGSDIIPVSALATDGTAPAGQQPIQIPEAAAAVQSLATAGANPGNSISPISNAPPFREAGADSTHNHGFSGSLALSNTQLEFGDSDHYSITSQIAYKPLQESYFFARTGITVNNSDEPLTYTWGLGYDDWHPGTWGFEINNWNPLKPGDGLDIDNAVVSLSRKFGWQKLSDHNLASSLSLNKSINSDFALTWLVSWAPVENWFVRTLLTQSLEGEGLSWAYGFGYNNWRKNTVAIEYNNWGFNEAFDTNFKENAIVTLSYKWEW